ncbi:MAG TPA: hypothetical protein DCE11_04980 [Ruminiclostridium sp.]|nr:hypothetical protein [Ruminiclostridium sp.]
MYLNRIKKRPFIIKQYYYLLYFHIYNIYAETEPILQRIETFLLYNHSFEKLNTIRIMFFSCEKFT